MSQVYFNLYYIMVWETHYDTSSTKRPYYFNTQTQEKTWINPPGTFETQMGTFTLNQTCNNQKLIETLKTNNVLNPELDISEYLLPCNTPFQNNSGIRILGMGTFGTGYLFSNNEKLEVIKITHNSEYVLKSLQLEERGFFVQAYLKKTCKHICDVYEFGRYQFTNDPAFLSTDYWVKREGNPSETYLYNPKIHKYISKMYTTGVYARIEYLDQTLDNFLEKERTKNHSNKDLNLYQKIFYGILDGLNCMHKMGFVHLDIKPENIGLVRDPDYPNTLMAKLFDFGFATYLNDKIGSNGTPAYIDPDYFDSQNFSLTSDVYAVGIMLYEFFTKENVDSVANKESYNSIRRELIDGLEPHLKDLIHGCLHLVPEERLTAELAMQNPWFSWIEVIEPGEPPTYYHLRTKEVVFKKPQDFRGGRTRRNRKRRRGVRKSRR